MKSKLYLLLCLFFLVSGGNATAQWKSLFNGENLTGWQITGDSAPVFVENGSIILRQKANTKTHTFLRTDKKYDDFILEVEAKRDSSFNYGILFRGVDAPDTAHVSLYGYQVKVDHLKNRRWTGAIFDDFGNTWNWLTNMTDNAAGQNAIKLAGEWDMYRIEAIGNVIKVWVNGVPTAHLINDKYGAGYIAFKIHFLGNNQQMEKPTAQIRSVRIMTKKLAKFSQSTTLQPTIK